MSTDVNIAKKLIHDQIQSQINTAQARLETLKAQAQATTANAELKLIADLLTKKRAIDQKLAELKSSNETTYQRTKSDVDSRVAELEQSVKGIEVRFRAMADAR
jgi:phage shock protein A